MRFYALVITIFCAFSISLRAQLPSAPDFAFPQKVSGQSLKALAAATKTGDGVATVRSLMNYALAQGAIDNDNITAALAKIDSVKNLPSTAPATRAVIDLFTADIYSQLYNQKRWVYDNRETSTSPRPQNFEEWSGAQFRERIMSLADSALIQSAVLQDIPIDKWNGVISCDKDAQPCFPSLYDFAAYKAISYLDDISRSNNLRHKILDIYRQLVKFNVDRPAAFIYSDIQRLTFVNNNQSIDRIFESLAQLFNDTFGSSSYSGLILLKMSLYNSGIDSSRRLHDLCGQWVAKYAPADSHSNKGLAAAIRSTMNRLEQQNVSANFKSITSNLHPLEIRLSSHNAPIYTVSIYRLPESYRHGDRINKLTTSSIRKIETINIRLNNTGIFDADTIIKVRPLTYGNYFVSVLLPGQSFNLRNVSDSDCFTVTDISLQQTSFGNAASIIAVNPLSGAPLSGIKLSGLTDTKAATDANGMYRVTQELNYRDKIYAQAGNDRYSPSLQFYHRTANQPGQWHGRCNVFTDLALYHPGDTVMFGGVAYEYFSRSGQASRLLCDKELIAVMYNANHIAIDTLACRTDDWGRIEGKFAIPADGLTGRFRIEIPTLDYNSSVSFMVSDYKLPTYTLSVTGTKRNCPENGDVTITLKAETYSGFPVGNARVDLRLSQVARSWWWRSYAGSEPFYTAVDTTDQSGLVSFVLPSQTLGQAPLADGIFMASFTAVSTAGESRETSSSFTLGATNIIRIEFPANFDISGKTVKLPVSVSNLSGDIVDIPLHYTLRQGETIVHEGSFPSIAPQVDWTSVKSGLYTITVSAADSTVAIPETSSEIAFYRPGDKTIPRQVSLWVPINSYAVAAGKPAKVLYGSADNDACILCTVWTADTILSQKWLRPKNGIQSIDVLLPHDVEQATVSLYTIHNFDQSWSSVTIRQTDVATSLKIDIESFRDHITSGQSEQWHLHVTDNTGRPAASALILDMYSKALDAITPHSLFLNFAKGHGSSFGFGNYTGNGYGRISVWSKLGKNVSFTINHPQFITYGQSFRPQILIRGRMMKNELKSVKEHSDNIVVEEAAAEADAGGIVETVYAAKSYNSFAAADMATPAAEETESEARQADEQYRMSETPLAFFRPMLTTDSDGRLSFSFTAPNANTTWRLCAAAFSRDLLTGTDTREIISNKPVMVQPNMPRFLRSGDTARILSAVMNNTDSTVTAVTVIETFNPASGSVESTKSDTIAIAARQSAIVPFMLQTPAQSPFIGFRIRVRIPGFSDGEQHVLPILEATSPVIETVPFYINPDSTHTSVNIPASRPGDRLTLQFCQNPAWYCVTALPGLRTDDARTANSAAAAIFSAAIAEGLMHDYPEIGKAIRHWNESDGSDSTLISMLERNQDLKTVLLNATPWMLDARSDTERMARLALLFDKKEINSCYSQNIDRLSKLSRKNGWAWTENFDEPSLWTTYNVLGMMGRLKQLGYLPQNKKLSSMIDNAISYIDNEAAKTFAKYPDSDFTQYVLIRGYFNDTPRPASATAIIRTTIQKLLASWRKMTVTDKAIAAIILNRNNYKTVSRQVLSSLNEYAKTTPQRGMWWPSLDMYSGWAMSKVGATSIILDAYAAITPQAPHVDAIRQWLILQKEAENWGTSVTTSDVIASILTSGSEWTTQPESAKISISGQTVPANQADKYLGYFRSDISPLVQGADAVLTIDKAAGYPAWGAVYSQYTAPVDSIAAAGCDAVTIGKRTFIATNTAKGVDWNESDNYKVGDRVRVQLTINVTRDMDYVTIVDNRAAAFEPMQQLPAPIVSEGIYFYQENRDASTRMFVRHLPKGIYLLTYDLTANNAGRFASGIATIQSQYAPQLTAHSSGSIITVE